MFLFIIQIDNLKKALAIKETERVPFSSKMKENVPTMESSSKQAAERTPPRSRRLSLETPTYTKIPGAPTKTSQSQFGFHAQEKSPNKMKRDVAINGQDDFSFSSTSSSSVQKSVRASVAINGQDDFSFSSTSRSAQKSVRASVVSKGSNIRKSIQSLGKLINASEKRYFSSSIIVLL